MKGKLIVIEGTDGSGKNTQSKLLVDKLNLNGYKSEMISFPTYGTPTGDIVGDCYLGKNNRIKTGSWFNDPVNLDPKITCLYYAADRRYIINEIREKLDQKINLVCDRYVESNMGHQCAKLKNENERKKLSKWIARLEYEMLELPQPDLIIFLYMPLEITKKLSEERSKGKLNLDVHESSIEHLTNAEQTYLELSKYYNWRKINCSENSLIRSIEDIHNDIYKLVSRFLDLKVN